MDKTTLEELNKLQKPIALTERKRLIRLCLFGEFGVGKTVLSAKIARKDQDIIFIMTDPGDESLWNHPEIGLDRVNIQEYHGPKQVLAVCQAINEKAPGYENVGTLVFDTFSGAVDDYIDYTVANYDFSQETGRVKAISKQGSKAASTEYAGLGDYHLAKIQFRPIIRALCKCNVDVIFVCHLREPSFLSKTTEPKRPTLPQQVFLLVARQCHLLGFMQRDGTARTVSFETNVRQVAKSRIKELDGKKVKANELRDFLDHWRNNQNDLS